MINAKHSGVGKVVISTDDVDNMGDPIRTDRHIDLEDAMRLYGELGEALSECRRFVVMTVLPPCRNAAIEKCLDKDITLPSSDV